MESSLHADIEGTHSRVGRQALWFFIHCGFALGSWALLMWAGYIANPSNVPQTVILIMSIAIPMLAGSIVAGFRQDEIAPLIWLVGLIWFLIVCLWVLDLPTGPNVCFQCGTAEKLARTFFSLPKPSGLIDDDGPFLGTWPAAALLGYAVGARLTLPKRPSPSAE
jgi:hypothetical protein